MKLPAKFVAALLALVLSGCVHKANQAQVQAPLAPPIEDTPPVKTQPPTDLPPPVITPPQPAAGDNTANSQTHEPASKPKPRKPAPTKPTEQQEASNSNPGVSAIGNLSTGDPADLRTQTENSLAATERGLRDIGRKLNDQEQKTAEQIGEFVKEARKALTTGDIDGARTLANKAKVLLTELTK